MHRNAKRLCLSALCLLISFAIAPKAFGAEEDPYKYNATASLIGGCGISKIDPVEDPGCPSGTHPPNKFSRPHAIAVDQFGNEYVASYGASGSPEGSEGRIDIFDSKGKFITEIIDPLGPKGMAIDSGGNLYVSDEGSAGFQVARYSPKKYEPKSGEIEYGERSLVSDTLFQAKYNVTVDLSNDHVFVSHGGSISEFSSAGEGNKLLDTLTHGRLSSGYSLAIDAKNRRLYSSSCPGGNIGKCWVLVFDADTHELIEEVTGENTPEKEFSSDKGWISVAVDETDGSFFVGDLELTNRVYKFAENGEYLSTTEFPFANSFPPVQIAVSNAPEPAANHRFLYVPSQPSSGVGHAYAFEPPGVEAPEIESVSVGNIGETEAELQARVEPSGGETTYLFEYTTLQAFGEKGFEGAVVAREGTIAGSQQKARVTAPLAGLAPGTAYRFRVFVENEVDKDEAEGSFATYDDASIGSPCPNDALRTVFSANLPDCRAYELVTPPDTNGRAPRGVGFTGDRFATVEVSPAGNTLSFVTEGGALPGTEGAGALHGDLYRSDRSDSGWISTSAAPTGTESTSPSPGSTSPDQGYAFWDAGQEGSAVIEGEATHYVHYPDGHSELVGRGSLGTDPRAGGNLITEDGAHIVFRTRSINGKQAVQLEPNAPPTGTAAVYDRVKNPATGAEETKVVSLLPGEVTPAAGENALYIGASADGEGIAFSIGSTLYLRVANEETFAIGTGLTFAGVSEGGGRIFYVEAGDLKAFDTASEEEIPFTSTGNAVPVNVAADGSRAYFVSTTALPGTNPNGASAKAGQPNLYLSEQGTISFVATVTARDVEGEKRADGQVDGLGLWSISVGGGELARDPSRLNPDGTVMLFSSRADLAGYDSEDTPQIYRYDSVGNRLHCISCLPTRQKAGGGASLQSIAPFQFSVEPFTSYGFVPNLTPDGNRAFFQSTEALVSTDNNGLQDVYEWEEAGVGSCTKAGGCVYLITSGHSDKDNYLYGHSRSGDDVFFTTVDVLSGFDAGDTVSIYDARVNGGFAEQQEVICQEGEDCRPASSPPVFPTPASEAPITAVPIPKADGCPKGKKKVKRGGKVVCVKKKKQKKKQGKRRAGKTAGKGAGR